MIPERAFGIGPRDAVRGSPDLDRVASLERRPPLDLASTRGAALVELMTGRLRRPNVKCGCASLGRHRCIDRLLPAQAWALYEAGLAGGLLAPIGVGHGKTLLDILVALVVPDCRVAALLIPPGLVAQFAAEYLAAREHFQVPSLVLPGGAGGHIAPGRPALHVVPYSRFSREEMTDYLERLRPDLIIADEAHALKNAGSVRTGRFLRYFAAHPETRLCAWSGSLTSRSIQDFAHLSAFALGDGSPLPLDPDEVKAWASAVDPSDWPAPPGALRRLAAGAEDVRDAVARRIVETRGVVATRGSVTGASIVLRERRPPAMPEELSGLIRDLHASWTRPDGEELVLALDVARCARELACGFYYRWRFPGDPPRAIVEEWRAARKAWHCELREKLKSPEPHLDSPLLCAKAAIRHAAGYVGDLPTWESRAWARWRDVRDTVRHETEAVWVSDYLVRDAAAWASRARGIVWYDMDAFGRAVAESAGLPLHSGGADAEARIRAERGDRSIIASIRSHGTGRDGLQYLFAEQLVANPPSSGDAWEQLLGRLHRQGQRADEVVTHVYRHTADLRDALDRALELAKFIEGITTSQQKLLAADVEFDWR